MPHSFFFILTGKRTLAFAMKQFCQGKQKCRMQNAKCKIGEHLIRRLRRHLPQRGRLITPLPLTSSFVPLPFAPAVFSLPPLTDFITE